MGFNNWLNNRAVSTSNRCSITVRASDPAWLDSEVAKMERKGYVRAGNPYTATQYGKMTFYQTMVLEQQPVQQESKVKVEHKEVNKKKLLTVILVAVAVVVGFLGIVAIINHNNRARWMDDFESVEDEVRTLNEQIRNNRKYNK